MDKYIIKCRYEYFADGGKKFTDWFIWDSTPNTEEECNEKIKYAKSAFEYIDKKTHLKHEYKLVPNEEYEKEQQEIDKHIKAAKERDEKYFASEEWKELKHKKYVARKERKQHQEEYKKMMEELQNEAIS